MAEWKEPFERFICGKPGSPAFRYLSPMFIVASLRQNLLSAKAIAGVALLIDEGDAWTEEEVDMGDGDSQRLLDLSISMLEQSYKLATSTHDEPQLAISAVNLLCQIGQKWPKSHAIVILQRLAATNELAKTRVYLQAISSQLPIDFEVATETIVAHLLHDFRSLVQRKHHFAVPLLLNYLTVPKSILNEDAEATGDKLELLYLLAEYFTGIGDYGAVLRNLEPFEHVWGSNVDNMTFDRERRRIKLCVARAYEVLGLLSLARELYLKCGQDDAVRELDACMAGDRIVLSKLAGISISKADRLATRQLPDGTIAIFCHYEEGQRCRIKFFAFDQRLMTLEERSLPHNGMMWREVMVVPDQPSEPLRLLVAPRAPNSAAGDAISECVAGLFESMFYRTNADQPVEYLEVWEYQTPGWHQIMTRGSRPDSYAVMRLSSHCAVLKGILVLFGGNQMENIGVSSTSDATSAGAFILNFRTREWLRVPHPYRQSLLVNSSGRPSPEYMSVSLPPFECVSSITVDGEEAIAMLRYGTSALNEKSGNELVPKYALDLFGIASDGSSAADTRPNNWWMLDVETHDCSGYIATLSPTAMQIGSSLVVTGSMSGMIQRLNANGTTHMDWQSASSVPTPISALDLRNMEWRGMEVHNRQLLTSDAGQLQFVEGSDPNNCHLVALSSESEKLQIFTLSGLNSVERSFTEPLSKKRLLSKKNTLSYQLRKSQERSVRALRECANCRIFESAGTCFQCCARCRVPFYCSRTCQSRHWKKIHKTECVTSTTKG